MRLLEPKLSSYESRETRVSYKHTWQLPFARVSERNSDIFSIFPNTFFPTFRGANWSVICERARSDKTAICVLSKFSDPGRAAMSNCLVC